MRQQAAHLAQQGLRRALPGELLRPLDAALEQGPQLQAQLGAQRERVMQLKAARNEASVLSREVDNAQRSYDALVGRQQLTQLESQTTQAQANWLSVAVPPSQPDSPRPVLNLLLATFFGAVMAVGVAWALEWRSGTHAG